MLDSLLQVLQKFSNLCCKTVLFLTIFRIGHQTGVCILWKSALICLMCVIFTAFFFFFLTLRLVCDECQTKDALLFGFEYKTCDLIFPVSIFPYLGTL